MKTGGSLSRFCYTLSKIHYNILQTWQFLFGSRLPKSCPFQNINFIGRKFSNFEGDGWKYSDIVGKNVIFFLKHPRFFLICLWVVIHFKVVISCVLDLTNSFREDW